MKTKTIQIGITSPLGNNKHVMLLESDNEFDIMIFLMKFHYCFGRDYNITIYKSNKGYHMISLNQFDYTDLLHFCIEILQYDMICNKQLGFAIRQEAFTLRITEKTMPKDIVVLPLYAKDIPLVENDFIDWINKEPKEIVYHQWGSLPISKPHYEIFKLFLNNSRFSFWDKYAQPSEPHIKFFDHGYELKGYAWEE